MKLYKRLYSYLPDDMYNGYISMFFSVVSVLFTIAGYYFIYRILSSILVNNDLLSALNMATICTVLLTLGVLFYAFSGIFSHKLGFRLESNLRKKGIDGIINASFSFFDTHQSGVIRKTIDDNAAGTHQAVAHMIPDMGQAFLTPILAIALGFMVSIELGIALIILTMLGILSFYKMMTGETNFMQIYQDSLEKLSGETVEYIRGIQVVKIFRADIKSFKALFMAINDYSKYAYEYSKSCKKPYVIFQRIFYGVIAIVMIPISFYINGINNPQFFIVDIIMLLFLSGIIFVSFMRIMYAEQHIFMAQYAFDNLENIYDEMLQSELTLGNITNFKNYDIEFDNVSFSYGDNEVFDNLSFKLQENRTYALVGGSGSGKSSIAKLLSGFYKVNNGAIKIGGKALNEYTEEAITKAISFVFQDPKLFKTTIYENIAIAKEDASKEEVFKAIALSGCTEIIEKFPLKENTIIGSKGVYLSGGEKQRIAIARAILKDSHIIIMDEASASIDPDNEYKLQESFKNLMKDKTVIMIAHRLSSIKDVDEIIVLDKGEIKQRGKHKELLENNGIYKKLVDLYYSTSKWRLNDDRAS